MIIDEVHAFPIHAGANPTTRPRLPEREDAAPIVSPMRRYPDLLPDWQGRWKDLACVVRARDGTWGFGLGCFSPPAASVINDHLGPLITGQNCMATEKLFDVMQRPVYELLGGPQKASIPCYASATGYNYGIEWFLELGFGAS